MTAANWRANAGTVFTTEKHPATGRRGMVQGSQRQMGPSALLDLGGVQVAVISLRQQLIDPAQLDVLGIDLAQMRTLVVKSRGHFRAAFSK